jgi:serine/threonine-protein kinase HipA
MKQLDVFMTGELIGHLREDDGGVMAFGYSRLWLARTDAIPLAPNLPLDEQWHAGEFVAAYFDNLLPEGGVRDFAARALHVSPGNVFALLERFGGDTAGALALLPQGQLPSPRPRYLPMTHEAVHKCFASSRGIPINLAGGEARIALAGAQDKMAVFIAPTGAMAIPLGDAPSSHIVKPSMDHRAHLPQTAINEALVMGLAAAIGLDVAPVRYAPELDAAVMARYDRQWGGGHLQRLHQNDLCQTLGIEPGRKHESEGGPTLPMCCAAVMQHSSKPALDKKRMLEWAVFNVAVGNMDSHAKNLSLLATGGHTRLAPFYDLVCTTVYEHLSRRFAFKIGGESRPGWIMGRHWDRLAVELAVKPQLLRTIRLDICLRIKRELPKVAGALRAQVTHPEGLAMIDLVAAEIRRCTGQVVARTAWACS